MPIKSRIIQFVEYLGVSMREFEKSIGVSNGSIKKSSNLSGETLANICRTYPTLSAEWILRDKGQMLLSEDVSGYTEGMARLPQKDAEEIAKLLHGHRAARYDMVAEDAQESFSTIQEYIQSEVKKQMAEMLNKKGA